MPETFKDRIKSLQDFCLFEAEKLILNHLSLEKEWRREKDRPYFMTNDNIVRFKNLVETVEILEDLGR